MEAPLRGAGELPFCSSLPTDLETNPPAATRYPDSPKSAHSEESIPEGIDLSGAWGDSDLNTEIDCLGIGVGGSANRARSGLYRRRPVAEP